MQCCQLAGVAKMGPMRVIVVAGCGLLLCLVVAGCGGDVTVLDEIDGDKVATMAERELEAQNPRLAPGTLDCPDLDFEAHASVRCMRTTELGQGRVVKVVGTVTVTSLTSGGRLHVAMDDEAQEFGLAGDYLAADVRRQYVQRGGAEPSRVDCPYLRGKVGTVVTCRLEAGGARHDVDVVVTAVDPAGYRTSYVAKAHRAAS
jgi:hypothetical protein